MHRLHLRVNRALDGILPLQLTALGFLCLVIATAAPAAEPDAGKVLDDTDLRTTEDLLRGFSSDELAKAERECPQRAEPELPKPVPRKVKVSGRVFLDKNSNGRCDDGEGGIAEMRISDGHGVIRTDGDGRYAFDLEVNEPHYRFIALTRPTGFRPTSPFFLRIPFAEDRTQYEADFGLAEDALSARKEFFFIAASDSQFTMPAQMIPIAKDYAQITSAPGSPAFLVTVGDLTISGTHYQWDMYDRIRGSSKIHVYEGFGGHDALSRTPRSTVNFEERLGPPYYSWEYGGMHFIQYVTENSYLSAGGRARQEAWLEADLAAIPPGTPVVVAGHNPLPGEWFDGHKAKGVNVICQIGAHWHVVQAGSRQGIPVLNAAPARGRDWGAFTRTYRWVHVGPGGVRTQLRVAGQYRRLEVVAPGPSALLGAQPLVVLAYDTARLVESVACRITGPDGETSTPTLTRQGDWSWHGSFDAKAPGQWRVELLATDVTGIQWKREYSIRVQQAKPAELQTGDDFPWLLAGEPPRRLARGPAAPLYPRWVKYTGSIHVLHSSPVVAGGRVYVGICNPNAGAPGAGVLCLDAKTGREVWRAKSPLGDIRGTVTVHDGVVYATSGEGWVAAYDGADGKLLWSRPLKPAYELGSPLAINQTPPVPTRHGLLVSDWQNPQYLLDYRDGSTKATLGGNVGYYAAFATVTDDVMYCACRGGSMALRIPGGDIAWKAEETSRSTSAGIVVDGKYLHGGSSSVKARDAATGKVLWQSAVPGVGYQNPVPVVWDDLVLANGTNFMSLDLATGQERWTVTCAQDTKRFYRSRRQAMTGSSTPLIAGDLAYFGHDDTSIRAVGHGGKLAWEHRLGTPIKTAPAASGNLLFVHDYAGNLWCFGPGAK